MARIAFHLRHPVANRLGRRLELLREVVGDSPCAHQLPHSAPVFRRIPCMTLGHRGSPSLSPLRHCPPNRVNSNLSLPSFISCIALLTFVAAFAPYCLLDDLIGIFFKLYFDRFDVSEPNLFFAHKLMPEQVNWICSGSCAYLDLP